MSGIKHILSIRSSVVGVCLSVISSVSDSEGVVGMGQERVYTSSDVL